MAMVTMELPSQPRNPNGAARIHDGCASIGSTGHVQQGETLVPDMIVHHVDGLLAERVTALAKLRQCSANDVMLDALRSGLGMSVAQQYSESLRDPHALTVLDGNWEAAERGVFQEALQALARTRPTQLAPENIRYDEPDRGAE